MKPTTKIIKANLDWIDVKNVSRTTANKEHTSNNVASKFKSDMMIMEHSPIRLLTIRFLFTNIKSWVATHFSRHRWECFISTGRSDRTGIDRSKLSQDSLVSLDGICNAQELIDTSRKRLCYCSSNETREQWKELKIDISEVDYDIAFALVPNGIYRGACPELMSKCNYCTNILKHLSKDDIMNIKARYKEYNKHFFNVK